MLERKLTIAEIILIAGTRVALGAGIGLLLSTKLNNDQRKAAGVALAVVGGLTTFPLALGVMVPKKPTDHRDEASSVEWKQRMLAFGNRFRNREDKTESRPELCLRYDGRLTTTSACPHIVRLSWFSYVSGGVRVYAPPFFY